MKNTTLGNARAILLLRGVSAQAAKIIRDDNKMMDQQRAYISEDALTNISITNMSADVGLVAKPGIKALLHALEDGVCGNVDASTSLMLEQSLFPMTTLTGAFSVVKRLVNNTILDTSLGTDEQWQQLLKELNKSGKDIQTVFSKMKLMKEFSMTYALLFQGLNIATGLYFCTLS